MKRFLIPALLLLACAAGTARADSSYTVSSETVPQQAPPINTTVSVAKFNESLGTLTGVTVTVNSTIDPVVTVVNLTYIGNGTPYAFTNAFAKVSVTATGPDGSSAEASPTYTVASGIASQLQTNYTGPATSASGSSVVPSTSWGDYEGVGNHTVNFDFVAGAAMYGGSSSYGLYFGGSATAGGTISVTYSYIPNPIPEPSSIVLAGIGMVGLTVFGRRRSRRSIG
jgi:hypothetical protein